MTESLRDQLQATLSGSYTLERELGGGGMSRVFLAEETQLNRRVVVKVLSTELAAEISAERFQREIRTAASLQQANIVPVLTAGNAGGVPYFTMPYVEGESLRARLGRTGALGITEAVKVLGDIARALAYAHERGIVHRDIKPDNVLLSGGTAVVTDFGIAKAITAARTGSGGKSATLTQLGTALGTPAYMAPEQAAGDPSTDHRADFYALGATAYELLTGRPPFIDKTPQRLLAAHMSQAPEPITSLRADIPPALAALVMRCLEKDAPMRPATATEIIAALDAVSTTSGGSQSAMPAILLGGTGMFRKALAIYAAAFVVVAIVAKAAIVGIGLPDWVFPGSLVVMALGLPVVLWTGYVQRVTRRAMTMTPTFTPGGSPSTTAHGTMATMALKAAPHVSWYKTARGGAYAFGAFIAIIAAFMGMRAFGIGPFGSLLATGALGAREQVILTDFKVTNTDSTLGRVVSDAVRAGLTGSSAFTIYSPAQIVAAIERMRQPKNEQVTFDVAKQVAAREGVKAIVDGEVTGVAGGYIVTLRLVRADSGTELASLRETGDGPKGLIDAADKLARALRSRAGESLRAVNATPPLAQVTTSSLDALRKLGEGVRLNAQGDGRGAIAAEREAVAIDSTFASAWSALGAFLNNWGGGQSAMDSAITQAFRHRGNLGTRERDVIAARYYALGPGRDRNKATAAYEAILQRGDSEASIVINLAETLRSRREYARAESLNFVSARLQHENPVALLNAVQLQMDQGKLSEASATLERLRKVAPGTAAIHDLFLDWAKGNREKVRRIADSLAASRGPQARYGEGAAYSLALLAGRLGDARRSGSGGLTDRIGERPEVTRLRSTGLELVVRGPDPALVRDVETAVAAVPFREIPQADRPYFTAAEMLSIAGRPAAAREMIARYHAETTDTSLVRQQQPHLHEALGYVALAENKPQVALDEFRKSDVGWDGAPATECAACVWTGIAKAFDAAAMPDSAIAAYERYLATPFAFKSDPDLDPVRVPAIHERLGQLYEAKGNGAKAAEHYRAFIDLWKNADPELQPRVEEAKRRLAKLAPVEPKRP